MATPNLTLVSSNTPAPVSPAPVEESTPPPVHLMSLFELEQELEAFENTIDLVPDADRPEFLERFRRAYVATAAKIDRTQAVRVMLESQITAGKQEIDRLKERGERLQRHLDRMDANLVFIIKLRDPDAKGKYKPLEGNVCSFSANKCPPSVQILDEAEVPDAYKDAKIVLSMELWNELLDALDIERAAHIADAVKRPEITIRKTDVKSTLQSDAPVPGAKLVTDKYSLRVK